MCGSGIAWRFDGDGIIAAYQQLLVEGQLCSVGSAIIPVAVANEGAIDVEVQMVIGIDDVKGMPPDQRAKGSNMRSRGHAFQRNGERPRQHAARLIALPVPVIPLMRQATDVDQVLLRMGRGLERHRRAACVRGDVPLNHALAIGDAVAQPVHVGIGVLAVQRLAVGIDSIRAIKAAIRLTAHIDGQLLSQVVDAEGTRIQCVHGHAGDLQVPIGKPGDAIVLHDKLVL